ncbi:hypothetical protein BHE74_00059132 [Ensete ventricosum]|nr:hypothetical protein BHE74_00059132 [Ensete ventricosum]
MLALPASDDVWWPGGAGAGSCRFLPSLWFLAAPSSPFLLLSCSLITHTVSIEALLSPPSRGDNVEGMLYIWIFFAALSFRVSNCVKKKSQSFLFFDLFHFIVMVVYIFSFNVWLG